LESQNSKLIDRIFDFYLIQNYHYLIQLQGGHYITMNNREKPIRRYMIVNHLSGKATLGTFASRYLTKFIAFDVDYRDQDTARWITYKIADALDRIGVDYAVSYSGGKGYHVDIFPDKAIGNDTARQFFDLVVKSADVADIEGGQVEFRPASAQGIKLPLGYHQKTGKYCGFCRVEDGLRVMGPAESGAYFLSLKKTDHTAILDAIADDEAPAYETREADDMENAIARYKPLESYDQSESYTLRKAAERYEKGLTGPGQRHKSILLLARFMNHNGIDREEAEERISEWMAWQDKRFYKSSPEQCAKDIRECVAYVYDKNLTLTVEPRDLSVSFGEIDAIIRKCPRKNHKAITYALLIHSKRWAGPEGTFYATYKQIGDAAGIDPSTVFRNISELEALGVIEIVRRNQKIDGVINAKKPNVYRMTLLSDRREDDKVLLFEDGNAADFRKCLTYFYSDDELRRIIPRRQYRSFLGAGSS
jgi:hypothetical protein